MKRAILFPFLFALYAVVNAVYANIGQLDPLQAARPLLALVAFAGGGMFLLSRLYKNWHYAGYLVFLCLAYFILFAHLNNLLHGWQVLKEGSQRLWLLAGWTVVFVLLGLRWVWRKLGGRKRVTPALNLVLTLALIIQLTFTLFQQVLNPPLYSVQADHDIDVAVDAELDLDCSNTPDIYYIILDGYGREEVLLQQYGVDTSPFIDELRARGFFVAAQSHTNYIQTIYSLSSSLNFEFIAPEPKGKSGFNYFSDLIAENRITAALEQCQYETIAFESGFFFTERPKVDSYFSDDDYSLNELENLLLAGSPVEVLADALEATPPEFSYEAHRNRVLFTLDELGRLPRKSYPTFVFAHIISPHPPFVFDELGNPVQPNWGYSLNDGDDFPGSWKDYQQGYAAQVQYLNQMLLEMVDNILKRSQTPPIIILQGDHGPGGSLNWHSPAQSCLWERTGILNAYYLPGETPVYVPHDISPVNTFRLVLNRYFGADLDFLPDKTYFTSHRLERQVIEITAQRDSKRNCALP